ncbi:helix-turn-helix domain-containing protein [Streptomyces canus]|uniref:AraC-like DNA-binding protein n=1 Tax=Streptomyces canus TaxID=58343 RepID=A0AAW8F5Z2_9ACTN|nr:helix-turn-helix domain-containing protein [Streptomyces canus]MDQ0767038.1 AraC-like DNA-binding protein [Streptomyces canus]MDQ0904923.1 AraC-like DNA-binding protein [Streptomyces canus]MDQ1065075.1 AraC-like DNA-binding protein [Streptomyces canus]
MSPVLLTSLVPDEKRLAYWRNAVNRALVPMTVVPRDEGTFTGRIATDQVGALRVSVVEADAQRAKRTQAHIARTPVPLVAVGVQMTGRTVLVQEGRQATADRNDLFVYDTSRPYFLDQPERFSTRVVLIPRRMLDLPDEILHSVSGTVIGTGSGCAAVLRPFLTTVTASAHVYSPSAAGGLVSGFIDLFSTLVAEQSRVLTAGAETTRKHLVRRVREYIDLNLGDPALSPDAVAKAQHISVRYLHRLFEDEGITVGRLIQRRRLEECAHELSRRSRTSPTVSAIAQRWGFVNPTHFSRVFRDAYGLSPRAWRTVRLQARDDVHQQVGALTPW